jgi:hypothetical protein
MIVPHNKVIQTPLQRMKYTQTDSMIGAFRPYSSVCISSSCLFHDKKRAGSEDDTFPTKKYPSPGSIRRLPAFLCAMYMLFTVALNPSVENTHIQSAVASNGGAMSCVAEHCSEKLSKCLSDGNCSRGMGCFVKCAAMDSIGSTAKKRTRRFVPSKVHGFA